MRIIDDAGREITNPDMTKGYLQPDKIFVAHHAAVDGVQEVGHYETIAEYPNGGKDVARVVDIPGVAAQDAWDEYEDVQRYIPYTAEELAEIEENKKSVWDKLAEAYREGVQGA